MCETKMINVNKRELDSTIISMTNERWTLRAMCPKKLAYNKSPLGAEYDAIEFVCVFTRVIE